MDSQVIANIINSVVAVATLSAVIVALIGIYQNRKQSREDWRHSQQLILEERQYQGQPIIVPIGDLSHHTSEGYVDWDSQYDITPKGLDEAIALTKVQNKSTPPITRRTEPNTQKIMLRNMGDGVAFNIHSFLYGPQSGPGNQYTSWNNGPIQGKGEQHVLYTHGATNLFEQTKVDGTHLLYDNSEPHYRIARLTTTYYDIFGRRHVSIFDYIRTISSEHRWMHIATKNGVEYDLEELDNQRQPVPNKRKPIK